MSNHILTIDDDNLLRRSLAFNLEQASYRVSTAASAEDALALADRDRPDLVLLDIGLPGMDGLEALRHFRERMDMPLRRPYPVVARLRGRRRTLESI
jgi:DNA-binding response OmpR family regulator